MSSDVPLKIPDFESSTNSRALKTKQTILNHQKNDLDLFSNNIMSTTFRKSKNKFLKYGSVEHFLTSIIFEIMFHP